MQTDGTNIAGKVVVITGASSGLGEATARYLAERGATVVVGARRAERLQTLVDELTRMGGKATAFVTDVTDAAQVQALVDAAVEKCGRIDVILNNAGVMPHSPLERRKIDDWNRTIDINIKGVPVRDLGGAASYAAAEVGPHHQRVVSCRTQSRPRQRGVRGDEDRSPRDLGRTAAGSQAVEHPHDDHLAGRRRDGVAKQHHRDRRCEGYRSVL